MTNKDKLLAFSALAILLTAGFPALAQDGDDAPPPSTQDERPDRPDRQMSGKKGDQRQDMEKHGAEMFAKADTDKDGFLTKEEMLNAHKERLDEMFAKTDADKDGKLSPEEMKKGREIMRAKFKEKMKDRMQEKREKLQDMKQDMKTDKPETPDSE
ncbi:MAG: EF-hand domain-containing protein [Alphaproteobacteria bacterium]|jgi:Ca2+-binding EF-hand superfamily protein|nr:EF-hand domain-containing protein [Alphaproteobacteria bacterium]MCB1551817.1 EF-hand domain-containing protein [Alphaproteobacteria bacterium]MCB9985371.1 EF-hand domain-containing protein [Micavibrio sp.]HPQ51096.1 EF-hand domain-containing protein [Alphaproteobacteria bacterium]HRK98149.1 EF-hand domain-containing protein [Alphaproteobacteria bacterium]